jgi:hypothetical protein
MSENVKHHMSTTVDVLVQNALPSDCLGRSRGRAGAKARKISLIGSTDTKNSSRVDKDPEFLEIY